MPPQRVYDRSSTGWDFTLGPRDHVTRPEAERERCGEYVVDGEKNWGDHRVTLPGSTCEDVACQVQHHPTVMPGWSEPMEDYYDRPGVKPIAAALWGWDGAGMHRDKIGSTTAWVAAHVALDALRDAGYTILPPAPPEEVRAEQPAAPPAVGWDDLAVGQVIRYRHRNRSQRLAHRVPTVRRARILDVWHPKEQGRHPQIKIEVLTRDGRPHGGVGHHTGRHTLFGADAVGDIVSIETEKRETPEG